ncbi:MAG: hypothetical protein Q7I89_06130 [Syntrophales bacterium]|nr:hypothetical protein [Syntrophales bacterium]
MRIITEDPGDGNLVDLLVNTYERTYRTVLALGFFPSIEAQNRRRFCNRIAIINNVDDREDAAKRAIALVEAKEIDEFIFVSDVIDRVLVRTGLKRKDLGRFPHFIDWGLVTVCSARSEWLLHWDAEISMPEAVNWVDPAIGLMKENESVFTANPSRYPEWVEGGIRKKLLRQYRDFSLGYGFSDQIFLVRTSRIARPIYNEKCLASLRYPLAHKMSSFEMRIDAYMRNHRLLQAIYIPVIYHHPTETEGLAYPEGTTILERIRKIRNEYMHRKLRNQYISKILDWIGKGHLRV